MLAGAAGNRPPALSGRAGAGVSDAEARRPGPGPAACLRRACRGGKARGAGRLSSMEDTRLSLLERVRNPEDAAAWGEFVALYEPLLVAYLRKKGVPEHDADD